ncbi:MAG: (2Fe-2S)-binding protein [Planctomycetota bacterium]|jgi:aerobic-type carbon monoxide dehydrogenase small subunit (CoxS/CutS family)
MSDDHTSKSNGFSRRRFLQTLGVSAATAPLARSADAQQRRRTGTGGVAILGPGPVNISLRINGKPYEATIDPATTLLDALRDRGACGGCSVLVDGKLTASCMMLAVDAIGSEITTVEGLAEGDRLDPVQESFVRHDALQCGYCTPGMIMAAKALLNENPRPTPQEIKRGLGGNLCRCGTYTNVVNAVLDASGQAPIRDGGGG